MKRLTRFLKNYIFFIVFLCAFITMDRALSVYTPVYIKQSGRFILNDFELTQRDHPEAVWDKVFFGNSTAYAAYREDESASGYVNLGVDYGVLTDLWAMIEKNEITIGSELVLALNWLTLYDDFETNPGYSWHRGTLEPYAYFERDKLSKIVTDAVKERALGEDIPAHYTGQTKTRYTSSLSDAELSAKALEFDTRFWHAPPEAFRENYAALERILAYCDGQGIRVRVLWMPWNPKAKVPPLVSNVIDSANAICRERGIEVHSLLDALEPECFADLAHLNHEYGSHRFTAEVDQWLCS